jgi:hypothetical protein
MQLLLAGVANPYPPISNHHEVVQLVCILREDALEPLLFEIKRLIAQAKQDNAFVRQAQAEDQFTEVFAVVDNDAVLPIGDSQHIRVGR